MNLIETTDDCPAGGSHLYEWVPAGEDTGLHFPGWYCEECKEAAPEDDGPDPDDARDEAWERDEDYPYGTDDGGF